MNTTSNNLYRKFLTFALYSKAGYTTAQVLPVLKVFDAVAPIRGEQYAFRFLYAETFGVADAKDYTDVIQNVIDALAANKQPSMQAIANTAMREFIQKELQQATKGQTVETNPNARLKQTIDTLKNNLKKCSVILDGFEFPVDTDAITKQFDNLRAITEKKETLSADASFRGKPMKFVCEARYFEQDLHKK